MTLTVEDKRSQFLRELHFIEAWWNGVSGLGGLSCCSFGNCTSLRRGGRPPARLQRHGRSSFGNCTSLRQDDPVGGLVVAGS